MLRVLGVINIEIANNTMASTEQIWGVKIISMQHITKILSTLVKNIFNTKTSNSQETSCSTKFNKLRNSIIEL